MGFGIHRSRRPSARTRHSYQNFVMEVLLLIGDLTRLSHSFILRHMLVFIFSLPPSANFLCDRTSTLKIYTKHFSTPAGKSFSLQLAYLVDETVDFLLIVPHFYGQRLCKISVLAYEKRSKF